MDTRLLSDGVHVVEVTATTGTGKTNRSAASFRVANTTTTPTRIVVDWPNSQTAVSGKATFSGWAIDDFATVEKIAVAVDGVAQGTATYGNARVDVCNVFPGRSGCPNVGWTFAFDTTSLADGAHEVEVTGTTPDGRSGTIKSAFTTSNTAGSGIRISVDRPNAQSVPFGGAVAFGGWATDDSASISSVSLAVDGVSYGKAIHGGLRADVCATVNRPGCPNV